MKLRTLAAACAALVSVSFAGAALAEPITAKLQAPVAAKTKVIAGGAVFLCEGDTCLASSPASRTFATSACKELAKNVGAITAFGGARKQLEADKLGQCNASAPTGAQVAAR